MKAKTIKAVLSKKFNQFIGSVQSGQVRDILRNKSMITGGSIVSMLLSEQPSDFDIYLMDQESAYQVACYYVDEFKKNPPLRFKSGSGVEIAVNKFDDRIRIKVQSAGIASEHETDNYKYFEGDVDPENVDAHQYVATVAAVMDEPEKAGDDKKYRPVFLTSNAITLSDKMQIVTRFFGEPEEIHKNYDYVHCTNYWLPKTNELVLRPEAIECILNKELRYFGSKYPLCSVIRSRKFIQRGWTINAGQYLKMLFQLSELNLSDPAVLEEQLVGVDQAYFEEIVRLVKQQHGQGKPIDNAYIAEIVDKVF